MSYDYLNNEAMGGNRVSRMLHAQQLEEAGNGDYDAEEDKYLRSSSFQGEDPEPDDERTSSMGSQYTRNSYGLRVLRPNELMRQMDQFAGRTPKNRRRPGNFAGEIRPSASSSSANGQLGSVEARRSDKVFGQYWSTFGERSKAAGGGVLGLMKSLFGRGMKRANQARYGS
jgi:hypothetical protein